MEPKSSTLDLWDSEIMSEEEVENINESLNSLDEQDPASDEPSLQEIMVRI